MIVIPVLLVCCSSLLIVSLTLLTCGKKLARPEPDDKSEFGENRIVLDVRLPWYTSGFE